MFSIYVFDLCSRYSCGNSFWDVRLTYVVFLFLCVSQYFVSFVSIFLYAINNHSSMGMFIYVWRQKKYLKNGRQDFFQFKEDDYYYFVPSSKQHRDHQHWLQCHSIPSRPSATWRTPRTRTLSTCTWLRYVKMSQAHRTAAEAATIPFQKHVHQKLVRRYFLILLLSYLYINL